MVGVVRQRAISWGNVDPDLNSHIASLGHNELNHWAQRSTDIKRLSRQLFVFECDGGYQNDFNNTRNGGTVIMMSLSFKYEEWNIHRVENYRKHHLIDIISPSDTIDNTPQKVTTAGMHVKQRYRIVINGLHHYIDVIMTTKASQITSLTVVYSTVYSDADQRNIKAPRHWPLCGEFTGTGEFPAQRASYAENVSI